MNAVDDVIGDADLKRAQLLKVALEAVAISLTCVIYAQMILDEATIERVKRRIIRWRNEFFGPPPMTEEQIQAAVHQVNIEATRTVREAWDES